jgi:hypothetical protein
MKQSGCWLLVACVAFVPLTARAEPPGAPASSAQAKQLCQLMVAGHLDAIAAQDPGNPNHFVAALFYPDAELLVVSAQFNAPQVLQALIGSKSYRDVYADLQTAQGASNQVFFIDMKADGLSDGRAGAIDVMYEPGNTQTVFDEDWRKQHGLGEREYQEKYRAAEQMYESLLHTLTGALASPLVSR